MGHNNYIKNSLIFYLEETLLLKYGSLDLKLGSTHFELVGSGHSRALNFGENSLEFILACLSHGSTLKVTETQACFWITFPLQMDIIHILSRSNVCFSFLFFFF